MSWEEVKRFIVYVATVVGIGLTLAGILQLLSSK
jgi:hypothetical protein